MKVILLTAAEYLRKEDVVSTEEKASTKETKFDVTTVEVKDAWTDYSDECTLSDVFTILGK